MEYVKLHYDRVWTNEAERQQGGVSISICHVVPSQPPSYYSLCVCPPKIQDLEARRGFILLSSSSTSLTRKARSLLYHPLSVCFLHSNGADPSSHGVVGDAYCYFAYSVSRLSRGSACSIIAVTLRQFLLASLDSVPLLLAAFSPWPALEPLR